MTTMLRLATRNPRPLPHLRWDGEVLRGLAELLGAQICAGADDEMRETLHAFHLSPFELAIVVRRLLRAGIAEERIRQVMLH